MPKFIKKSPSQPVGRRNLSTDNISARIGLGADGTPIGEPSTIVGDPCAIVGDPRVIVGEQRALDRIAPLPGSQDMITELARAGAKQILAAALEQEIQEYLEQHINLRDEQGHQQVVRNGYCRPRSVLTGIGGIEVEQPRVRDKREESEREKFTSKILPPYLRKAKTLEEFIPILYLRGVE